MISFATSDKAMYLTLLLNSTTELCCFDLKAIGTPNEKMANPNTLNLESLSPAQSEAPHPTTVQ